ncbi:MULTISPECIES: porin [unclassified Paraflavitalea]|uniref:porin n=1 Tax=unclassified Paraflavitalea TaxID=2798305 RepID=UPI003D334223
MSNTFVKVLVISALLTNLANIAEGQKFDSSKVSVPKPVKKPWYESFSIRGYMQVRYNRLLETNPKLKCEQCDRSIGEGGGFIIRRGRIIISGQIANNVYIYIQPDFGSSTGTTQNIFQLRDAYVDIGFDKKNEFRLRVGQSKVPFGFENMQSSQNRLPLDRADALNSAVSNERDLGAFFYWAPESTRKLFASLIADNLKGSGDYGVFAFGAYNGQTANRAELNNTLHIVSRLSYPFKLKDQIIEPGIQAYTGKYVLPTDLRSTSTKAVSNFEFLDTRAAASFVLYPKPLGIQAEYNIGKGPQYNPSSDSIEVTNLKGGYATISYKINRANGGSLIPYTRIQRYEGGKKHELDSRRYDVKEIETGLEWQVNKYFELTTSYVISERRFEDSKAKSNLQKGNFLRIQVQVNF